MAINTRIANGLVTGYCDVPQVQRITNLPTPFAANTRPTLTQVEELIQEGLDQINAFLEGDGHTLPITSQDDIDDKLSIINAQYAAAHIWTAINDLQRARLASEQYVKGLDDIEKGEIVIAKGKVLPAPQQRKMRSRFLHSPYRSSPLS